MVWYGLNWSFELNDQGNCRLYRQGSPYDKVFVHYLVVQGCQDEDVDVYKRQVEDWQPNENAGRCRRGTKR